MGVSADSLQRYIREENMPPLDVAVRLCAAAGVRLDWLALGTGPMRVDDPESRATLESQPVGLDADRLDRAVRIVDLTLDLLGVRIGSEMYARVLVLLYGRLAPGGVLASDHDLVQLNRFVLEKLNQIGGLDYAAAARSGDRREPGQGGA